eukprot:COSAG05_NODE_697_length_7869_cov_14.189937_5_plen_102_part_00
MLFLINNNKALEADIQLLGLELPAIAASRAESPRPQQRRRVDPTAVSESEEEGWEDDTANTALTQPTTATAATAQPLPPPHARAAWRELAETSSGDSDLDL